MIFAFVGKTGSGKTLSMVNAVYPRWLGGADIYSNIELNFKINTNRKIKNAVRLLYSKIIKKEYKPINTGRIFYFHDLDEIKHIKNAVILLDEGQEFLGAYDWRTNDQDFIRKLRMQRKQRLDIYTTSQNIGAIDLNYRKLVQGLYYCRGRFHTPLTYHYIIEKKHIYELYNQNIDDLKIKTKETLKRFIFKKIFNKNLYNTLEEVSSKKLKIVWLIGKKSQRAYIIPKKMSLKQSLTATSTMKSQLK